jgi:cytoskeletal protein CcmA (bactofilin family)
VRAGPTLHFKGELYGEEDLEFQGQLEGSIEHTRSLSIGKEGSVKGNIRAKFVIIEGRVDGDVYATESVSVRQSAKVNGNIFAPRVGLADGAHFLGPHRHEPQGRREQGGSHPPKSLSDPQPSACWPPAASPATVIVTRRPARGVFFCAREI